MRQNHGHLQAACFWHRELASTRQCAGIARKAWVAEQTEIVQIGREKFESNKWAGDIMTDGPQYKLKKLI